MSDRPVEMACSFRQAKGAVELWDAETGEIRRARQVTRKGGRTHLKLSLKPSGSVFVVFRPSSEAPVEERCRVLGEKPLAGPWKVTFGEKSVVWTNLLDWAQSPDADICYFSGTASYETTLALPACAEGRRLVLGLGEVKNLATVFVEGVKVATLWRPPFECVLPSDGAARTVRLRIDVANLWANRLIGDDRLYADDCEWASAGSQGLGIVRIPQWVKDGRPSPTGRRAFTTWKHWQKGDSLLPSGLLGPVALRTEEVIAH